MNKKITGYYFLLIYMAIISCQNQNNTSNLNKKDSVMAEFADSVSGAEGNKSSTIDSTAFKALETNFIISKDGLGRIAYFHKYWKLDSLNYTTVYAYCTDTSLFLVGNYYGRDTFNYNTLTITINHKSYSTKIVTAFDKKISQKNANGYITEIKTFPEERQIIATIADSTSKKIEISFNGKHSKNISLSQKDASAFKDVWNFYSLRTNGF